MELDKSAKSKTNRTEIKTPFEEIEESIIELNLVKLCVSSVLGKKIKTEYERSEIDENNNTILCTAAITDEKQNDNGENKRKIERKAISPVSTWMPLPLKYTSISKKFVANYLAASTEENSSNTDCYILDESVLDQPADNKNPQIQSDVERIFRTVLPTAADQVVGRVPMTPVTFIIPTELPLTTGKTSTTQWEHIILEPYINMDHLKEEEKKLLKINITNRILLIFQALNITSLKTGRKKDQVIFSEIATSHPILKSTVDFVEVKYENKDKKLPDQVKYKSIKKNPYFVDRKDEHNNFHDIRGNHNVSYSNLRVEASRSNDVEAPLRDIDLLSKGLASLTTYLNAVLITIYIESSPNDLISRPYIIAPKKIIDMFLDLRDHGFYFQKYYENNNYGVQFIIKTSEREKNKWSIKVKRLKQILKKLEFRQKKNSASMNLKSKMNLEARKNKTVEKINEIIKLLKNLHDTTLTQLRNREEHFSENHLGKGLYPKKPTKKSASKKSTLPPVDQEERKKYKSDNTVKLSEMRSSLGFRVCRIDFEDFFDSEGIDFDKLADQNKSRKSIVINFPIPYRYL